MKRAYKIGWPLVALCCSAAALADSQLRVQVQPSNSALSNNIEGHVGELEGLSRETLERRLRGVREQARQAAEALGYYHAQIDAQLSDDEPPTLELQVEAGEPVRLRNVQIRIDGPANQLAAFRVPDARLLRPGTALNHGVYEDAKTLIENQAARYGFFAGHFTQSQLLVDPEENAADITLIYQSGPRYRLGHVNFSGDTPFDDDLLRRMVPFAEGAPYDSELINRLYQALQSSGYFQGVRVDAAPASAKEQAIPVEVRLTTRKPRTMGLGLGYSTDVGPRGRAEWTRHWVNPQGHSYGAEMELSAPRQNVGLWYDMPGEDPLNDKLRIAGGYQYEELADTDSLSKLITVGPEWHRRLESGWQRVYSVKWLREEYRLGDDSGLATLTMPGIELNYLNSDNRLDPSRGYRLRLQSQVAKDGLLSDADLLHSEALAKGLITLAERHRFLARGQLGMNFTNEYKAVPPSLRFFAGGDQSVRGYDYQTLSPTNSDGDRIGGRYMIAGSLEYQYSFADRWRVAAFVDQGNSFSDLELPSLKTGVGFGLRWVSPVGPLRVDLAHPLDGDGGIRLHFSMGPEL